MFSCTCVSAPLMTLLVIPLFFICHFLPADKRTKIKDTFYGKIPHLKTLFFFYEYPPWIFPCVVHIIF